MSPLLTWATLSLTFLLSVVLVRHIGDACDYVLDALHNQPSLEWDGSDSEPPEEYPHYEYDDAFFAEEWAELQAILNDEARDEEDHR
jgi:hypothetical protein